MGTYIRCMHGLGDNIYIRGYARSIYDQGNDLIIETPWPELYCDFAGVKFVKPETRLRTQAKNIQHSLHRWSEESCRNHNTIRPSYGRELSAKSIPQIMQQQFGCIPTYSWPWGTWRENIDGKPIAVIRPSTLRHEWFNIARAPLPEYLCAISELLRDRYHIISIADIDDKEEWLDGCAPYCDECYNRGELPIADIISLVAGCSLLVGRVS